MRWIIAAISALAFAPVSATADNVRFPRAALVESSFHQTVPPVRAFLKKLKELSDAGEFYTGGGVEPRDDLGGLSAKQWLMANLASDFECRRDFGGICGSDDPRVRLAYAILGDEGWRVMPDTGPDVDSKDGLALLEFDVARFLPTVDIASGDGESCVPAIGATSPDLDTLLQAYLGSMDLEAHENFIGVYGRYRVRAKPSLEAPVVNTLSSEAVFRPGPTKTHTIYDGEKALTWTFVVPGDGAPGFIPLEAFDTISLSEVVRPQLCVRMVGGQVKITAFSGGGD